MLVLCSVHNYRSHLEPSVLNLSDASAWATGDNYSPARVTMVTGDHGGGVTSLLDPVATLSESVLHPIGSAATVEALYQPHLANLGSACRFSTTYSSDGFMFRWNVNVDARGVQEEELLFHTEYDTNWQPLFRHVDNDVSFGRSADVSPADQAMVASASGKMALALPALRSTKKSSPSRAASAMWTRNMVCIRDGGIAQPLSRIVYRHTADNLNLLRLIPPLLEAGGFEAQRIGIVPAQLPARLKKVAGILNDIDLKSVSLAQTSPQVAVHGSGCECVPLPHVTVTDLTKLLPHAAVTHKTGHTTYALPFKEHSASMRAWMRIGYSAGVVLITGTTLLIDNVDSHITPQHVEELVSWFQNKDMNPHDAQLIIGVRNPELAERLAQRSGVNTCSLQLVHGVSQVSDHLPHGRKPAHQSAPASTEVQPTTEKFKDILNCLQEMYKLQEDGAPVGGCQEENPQ